MSRPYTHKRRPPEGFGARLREAVYKSGYSNNQIERLSGVNHSNISDYMSEKMAPSAWTLASLCKALNVSADYLLFGKEVQDNGVHNFRRQDSDTFV